MRDWAKLHADISKSRSFAAVCNEKPEAGLVFLMMLPRADILGIVDAHPVVFRGEVCPLLDLSEEDVEECLQVIQKHNMLVLYEDDKGDRWGWVRNWAKYQQVRWTHVGPTGRPLPDCWESPDGLDEHLRNNPDTTFSRATVALQSDYCSTTKSNSASLPSNVADQIQSTDTEKRTEENDVRPAAKRRRRPETEEEVAIRQAFEMVTGEELPKGIKGYAGARKLVSEHGIDELMGWARAHNGTGVPNGANAWEWFKRAARDGLKRKWEWQQKGDAPPPDSKEALLLSIPGMPANYSRVHSLPDEVVEAIVSHPRYHEVYPAATFLAPVADAIADARDRFTEGERGTS